MDDGSDRPSTLVISPWTPYPLVFGGAIRVYYLIKMLASFSDVTLVAFDSSTDAERVDDVEEHLGAFCARVVIVGGKPAQTGALRARSLLSPRSFQYHAHHTEGMQTTIDEVAADATFDNVVVTLTQMGSYRLPPTGLRVLDTHNIEHELLSRRADMEAKRLKRVGLRVEAVKFKREELAICRSYDLVLTPSDRERDILGAFGGMPPIATVPNTIDPDRIAFLPDGRGGHELLFVGATQVDANRDGLMWFARDVLPLIERAVPEVTLRIVGGAPPPEVRALGERPNIEVTGFVPEIAPAMADAAVFVVPLRSGGGTRLKILESLAYGVPTVSTAIGAEGLDLVDGEDLLVSDDPVGFARHVVALLEDRALGDSLRHRGRAAVEVAYSWRAVAASLEASFDTARRERGERGA
ncbi:MAG: glycosyltransferase family 4 protein [Ilumatobacteraceae bacterium]